MSGRYPFHAVLVLSSEKSTIEDRVILIWVIKGLIYKASAGLVGISSRSLSAGDASRRSTGQPLSPTRTTGHPRVVRGERVPSTCEQLSRAPVAYLEEIQSWVSLMAMQASAGADRDC